MDQAGRSTEFEQHTVPLCVDLDGTLIRSDLLHESFAAAVRQDWLTPVKAFYWLAQGGKCRLKGELAARAQFDVVSLPYRPEVIDFLRNERAKGRRMVLATAAAKPLAEQVARHLDLFDTVLSTDVECNLKGANKLAAIQEKIGREFDYIGDCDADSPLFTAARTGYLVCRADAAMPGGNVRPLAVQPPNRVKALVKLLRPQQWMKNLLVLLPLIFAHKISDLPLLVDALLGLAAFSLIASTVYVLNDFLDVHADRLHHRKKNRPLASGAIPILWAPGILAALVGLAGVLCLLLPGRFAAVLIFYAAISASYSFFLKTRLLIDVMVLAGLYTIRIIAGAAATSLPASEWLLAFSMFIFSSLAFAKRYAEVRSASLEGKESIARRSYVSHDLPVLLAAGLGSGLVSVLVLALYINYTPKGLYGHPQYLWMICPLMLYWVTRIWFLANRGTLHDDPVVFAMTDRISWLCGVLAGGVLLGASFG